MLVQNEVFKEIPNNVIDALFTTTNNDIIAVIRDVPPSLMVAQNREILRETGRCVQPERIFY